MRTREEMLKVAEASREAIKISPELTSAINSELILEILLDIRDLLTKTDK